MKNKFNIIKITKLNNYFINQFNKIPILKKRIINKLTKLPKLTKLTILTKISNFNKSVITFIRLLSSYLFYLISNFNKSVITFISLLFSYLLYLFNLFNIIKITKLNNYFINQFNKIPILKKTIINKLTKLPKLTKISNFNKSVIIFISLLFSYVFYLSIPSLYDNGRIQKDFTNKILNEFKINISISSDISYSILPSPHFVVKNAKIFNDDLDKPKEISQIKKLNIYVSQKNLFDQDNLNITKIIIQDANFLIQKNDFKFIDKFLQKKFSKKKITIKNSNVFYKDSREQIISIFPISKINIFYNEKKLINEFISVGQVFNIPFKFNWSKNFEVDSKSTTLLKLKKLNIEMLNESSTKNNNYYLKNNFNIGNFNLDTEFKLKDELMDFSSIETRLVNNNINYKGQIYFEPFNFKLDVNLYKIDFKRFFDSLDFFKELLKLDILYNQNLSSKITLSSKNLVNNKLFDNSKILFNVAGGKINFDNSYLHNKKIGKLILSSSNIGLADGELIFSGNLVFNIYNQKEFYRIFQIPKINRKLLKKVFIELEANLFSNEVFINNFKINNLQSSLNKEEKIILEKYDFNKNNKIKNWIDLKNSIRKNFAAHEG